MVRRRTQDANPFDGINAGSKSAPALADLDADGDLDVVIGSYDGTVTFLENTGSREAPAFVQNDALFKSATDAGYTHPKPTLADVDGRRGLWVSSSVGINHSDLVLGHLDDTLAYFLNTGNATAPRFVADATNPFASLDSGRDSSAPTLSDLDGDGTLAPRPYRLAASATARAHRRRFGPGRRTLNGRMSYFENVGFAGEPLYVP